MKIYALKTSPAFEAAALARYSPGRVRGTNTSRRSASSLAIWAWPSRSLNDLKDWRGDDNNKLAAGGDVLGGRPTVLWALALEGLDQGEAGGTAGSGRRYDTARRVSGSSRVRQLYHEAGVFEKAHRLVDKHQQRAESIADEIQPEELRRLFYYLIDSVLERPENDPPLVNTTLVDSLT